MDTVIVPRSLTHPRPAEHFVQLYEDESRLMRALEWFVLSGLEFDGAVIMIASDEHLAELDGRLAHRGVDLARREGRYLELRADDVLDKFMLHGWPNSKLFDAAISAVLAHARNGRDRPVRAFGEMVAMLMARGNPEATLRLEQLWNGLLQREGISLFCGYPRPVFRGDASTLRLVCESHAHVLPD
jgi:hypothetical protein